MFGEIRWYVNVTWNVIVPLFLVGTTSEAYVPDNLPIVFDDACIMCFSGARCLLGLELLDNRLGKLPRDLSRHIGLSGGASSKKPIGG